MNITVNNNVHVIDESTSLNLLIDHLSIDDKGIAIAINLSVIPKAEWHTTELKENDNITIIKATQGG